MNKFALDRDLDSLKIIIFKVKEMLAPREKHCAASLNGKIFVFGGSEEQNGQPLNSIDCYDGIVDTWKREGVRLFQKRFFIP